MCSESLVERLAGLEDPINAYQTCGRLCDIGPADRAMIATRERTLESKTARALLGARDPGGRIQMNPYRKWQGPNGRRLSNPCTTVQALQVL